MLPRIQRIDGVTLSQLLPQSKTYRTDWGSLRFYPAQKVYITCIISKKTAKLSPDRHRIKRKCYEAIRSFIPNMAHGYYFLFPRKELLYKTKEEIEMLFFQSLQNVSLLK